MLKFIFMLLFLIPLGFSKNSWWLVQSLLFFMGFLFMFILVIFPFPSYVGYNFFVDVLSYGLIILSIWVCGLMIMASESVKRFYYYEDGFLCLVILLLLFLFCTFSSSSLFSFYLFFEASLIPTLLLIMGWGYQPERLQAGIYLLFYTLLGSLPLLVSLLWIYGFYGTLYFMFMEDIGFTSSLVYLSMILAFLIKTPMFLVHLWLPSAHVEAPVSGSMILAGVLLKLGGYGLLRVYLMLISLGMSFNFIWIGISLIGGFLVSLMCLRQMDLKALIAYSSVVHMGMALGGLMTMTGWGFMSTYTLMIAHGLCSSGLFALANISYERLGSRSLFINKGLMNFMPSMAMWWFLLSSSNMAAPPSLNLMGEIGLLNSLVMWSGLSMIMLMLISFFSAAYTLYMYSYSQHGSIYSGLYSCSMGYTREYLLLLLHWLPLNILVLRGDMCILWL
uniref:NADH-ubiquinone oxidoreductase chain 4 n=1 Tax=Pseudorhynchus acuminatus TaxID=1945536 RepID=A0A1Q1MPT1_9ORTH|nr:NADH dehydrogenase subunit 4 [Pseudorhynchus acuminatus]AQM40078.1 NADH dehydrogenase subunit 4 [Pseudorhynchus acuminatus]